MIPLTPSLVLACEGPELKGYLSKQSSGIAVRKHMHNCGINSFNFHSSPRMVRCEIVMVYNLLKITFSMYYWVQRILIIHRFHIFISPRWNLLNWQYSNLSPEGRHSKKMPQIHPPFWTAYQKKRILWLLDILVLLELIHGNHLWLPSLASSVFHLEYIQ